MLISDVETLRAACCIAGLDGKITDGEKALIDKLADKVGVGHMSLNAMIDRAKKDHDFYKEQFRFISADPLATMKAIFAVAVVDGELGDDERMILKVFAERLGLKPEDFDKLMASAEKYLTTRKKPGDTSSPQA